MGMFEKPQDDFEDVAQLFEAALPGRLCLRCGHDKFYLLDDSHMPLPEGELTDERRPVTKIACTKCGMIEEHLTGVLRSSLKKVGGPLVERKP